MIFFLIFQCCYLWNVKGQKVKTTNTKRNELLSRSRQVRDELTLSPDDNEDAPDDPIWFCGIMNDKKRKQPSL